MRRILGKEEHLVCVVLSRLAGSQWTNICDGSRQRSSYLPHSRITLEVPINTATKFPKLERATKKLSPRTDPAFPNTLIKNKLAADNFASANSTFGTAAKYAIFAKIYSNVTISNDKSPFRLSCWIGFFTSATTLNACSNPVYEKMMRYRAFVKPYPVAP